MYYTMGRVRLFIDIPVIISMVLRLKCIKVSVRIRCQERENGQTTSFAASTYLVPVHGVTSTHVADSATGLLSKDPSSQRGIHRLL